ncbi:ABC transporter substrate-binding protein [Labrenzia sp. PHM005]|uniref:substrate-binding periplasmic protein n=1 Tax=Labrenzia sp. PHM005 TaxID=2590016 RepID=UPI001140861C|nr:ABC transporter substrate-binding protein [Labrenzia sp. PHM005]QDG77207.1 ABC transporter substrate-binding protein [Labrenzia sp. PHM005]
MIKVSVCSSTPEVCDEAAYRGVRQVFVKKAMHISGATAFFSRWAAVVSSLFLFCTPSVIAEEPRLERPVLVTGQAEDGYRPFLFPVGAPRRGIYYDIAERVTAITGIEIKWEVMPATRGRYLFESCQVQLEFGVSPTWYSDKELANSHFSEPFMKHIDALAYAGPDQGVDQISVKDEPVLAILGYRYPTFEFDERFDVKSERTMIMMLHQGRAKAGILEKTVGQYLANDMGVEINFAQTVETTELSLRVHPCAEAHLPALNQAIAELKNSGEIGRIMESYLKPVP